MPRPSKSRLATASALALAACVCWVAPAVAQSRSGRPGGETATRMPSAPRGGNYAPTPRSEQPRSPGQPAPIVRESPAQAAEPTHSESTQISQASPYTPPGDRSANAPGNPEGRSQPLIRPNRPAQNQQHLNQWMEAHRNLPIDQQQRALQQEPGFNNLNPALQQRMHDRLNQLNSMAPAQRQRVLARTEAMERLTMPQRQQVSGALRQLGSLPPDRQRAVSRAFHATIDMPEPQRQAWLNSPQTHAQFTDSERATLGNLYSVAPMASQAGLTSFTSHPPPAYQPPRQ